MLDWLMITVTGLVTQEMEASLINGIRAKAHQCKSMITMIGVLRCFGH